MHVSVYQIKVGSARAFLSIPINAAKYYNLISTEVTLAKHR
ncbi:hypothetical protein GCM10010217_74730 [Streptomyces tubercidicus]